MEGECIAITGVAIDVTKEKQSEFALKQAQEKAEIAEIANQAKSEFIANMSHDLRTPVTGMLGLAQSWQMNATSSKDREDASLLIDTIYELLNLLNEILEAINLGNSRIQEKIEMFSIKSLIKHNITLLQSAANHKHLNLTYQIDLDVPSFVYGNRIYLDRSLLNLLSNAIKFTDQGSVQVSISLEHLKNKTAILKFTVKDTGIGIPKDKFDEIFKYFSRLTSSYQGIYKGSGLGLYIVQQYVSAMKGTIQVDSTIGQGSTFILTIPFKVSEQDKITEFTDSLSSELNLQNTEYYTHTEYVKNISADDRIAHVLVVEDNPLAARMTKQILQQARCSSDWASNGEASIEAIHSNHYDLVLMDIGLPDIDGLEATRQIRKICDTATLPILALTGHLPDKKKRTVFQVV